MLFGLSSFGIALERRTVVGKALSAPLATMSLALTVANLGLLPFQTPVYSMINQYFVALAVPMLLFDSDVNRVFRDTESLLIAFGVGALATVLATLIAYPLVPLTSLGRDTGWKIALALAARHIGGAINFVAVAETLHISASAISAAIAADNVAVALYFAGLFALAGPAEADEHKGSEQNAIVTTSNPNHDDNDDDVKVVGELEFSITDQEAEISLSTIATAISVASVLVTVGGLLTKCLLPGTSALPLTSMLTVVSATCFPRFFARIRSAGAALGIFGIQMFFAASGASGSIGQVLKQAPSLFLFSALQIGLHFGFLMMVGRGLFRLPARELYLASNANVGGPTTAAAMAQAKNWKRLVLPALLVGILGYATATAIALALSPVLRSLPVWQR